MAFYPRALARITTTVQTSRERDELEECAFDLTPREVSIERNEFSKADECSLTFDSSKFPVLPRNIRQALALVHVGDTRALGRSLTEASARWLGYIDEPDVLLSESEGTVHWKGRDYTGLLLDARRPPLRIVPTYGDNLETALRRILNDIPGGENIKLRLHDYQGGAIPEWPELADAAPPGLRTEKIAYDPNDTIWKLIERLCDPFGLIPQIKLDTLEIATSRGSQRPKRLPLFVLGGGPGGIVEYQEKRSLSKIREGIALSGYDLSTGGYIVAQWPPSGDASIAKKLKATKVIKSKSGKHAAKVSKTVGANAAVIDKNDKRHGFAYGNVADEKTLLVAARALYENRSRQEFEGSLRCTRMTVPHVLVGQPFRDERFQIPEFDVLSLTSGDRVFVDVAPEYRQLLAGIDSTNARRSFLADRGFDRAVADVLVKTYERGVQRGLEVYVRSVSFSLGEDGFSMDLNFQALLSAAST